MEFSKKTMLGLVFLIIGLALAAYGLFWLSGPPQFQATARIKFAPDTDDFNPWWAPTFEIIQSDLILSNVVAMLHPETAWGNRWNGGNPLSIGKAISRLRRQLTLTSVRNTKIAAINVCSEDSVEAARLANAICEAYANYREESQRQLSAKALKILQAEGDQLTRDIQNIQTNLDNLRQILNITNTEDIDTQLEAQMHLLSREATDNINERDQLLHQLNQLKAYDKQRQRLRNVPTINQDSELSELLSELHEAELKKAMRGGFDDGNPTNPKIIRPESSVDTLNRQIDAYMAKVMADLEAKLKAKTNSLDAINKIFDATNAKYSILVARIIPFWDAKMKLEEAINRQRLFKTKLATEWAANSTPLVSSIQIVDPATPPTQPIGPNRLLGAVLFVIGLAFIFGGWFLLSAQHETTA